jgi:putative redox protein
MGERTSVDVEWIGNGSFVAKDSEGHSTLIQVGKRESLSPSQLFLASLASCSLVDVVSIMGKRRKKLTVAKARVEGERVDGYPTRYSKIKVTYYVKGPDVTGEESVRAIELSQSKYCSVSLTVKNGAQVEWTLAEE